MHPQDTLTNTQSASLQFFLHAHPLFFVLGMISGDYEAHLYGLHSKLYCLSIGLPLSATLYHVQSIEPFHTDEKNKQIFPLRGHL